MRAVQVQGGHDADVRELDRKLGTMNRPVGLSVCCMLCGRILRAHPAVATSRWCMQQVLPADLLCKGQCELVPELLKAVQSQDRALISHVAAL